MHFYAIIYKPYRVLSQFTAEEGKLCLRDFFDVPVDVYPVGRLDYDSEGMLILTNDRSLNNRLLHPRFQHEREYWVQVDGAVSPEAIQTLAGGVTINVEGKYYRTRPCHVSLCLDEPPVAPRNPPIRFRKNIPAPWLKLVLTEGKNRQVRKMTAATGCPTLRLIRYRIGQCTLEGLMPGDMRILDQRTLYRCLFGA